ncbi:MAG: permease-like cell division protein FtsX [Melioribacteraceae bacterium]
MFFYYLKETFSSLVKSKLASLLIISTTAIAIIFVTFSIGLVVFSKIINTHLKDNIQISLFINDNSNTPEINRIEKELNKNVYVASQKFISKNEALNIMKEKTGKDFSTVLDSNPLPAMFQVKLTADSINAQTIEPIIKTLKKIKGIDDVVYDYSLTLKVLNYINESKKVIYSISIILVLLSIYLVYSNNRLLLATRLTQYNTMKLVGAKLTTIKIPIILNGIVMGIFSSIICLAIYFVIEIFLSQIYAAQFIKNETYYIVSLIIILGIVLGFLGSYLSTLKVSLKINKIK